MKTDGVLRAGLVLALQGKVELDAKVADYWPEFGGAGKEACTVRQLLCHQVRRAPPSGCPLLLPLSRPRSFASPVRRVGTLVVEHTRTHAAERHHLGVLLLVVASGACCATVDKIEHALRTCRASLVY